MRRLTSMVMVLALACLLPAVAGELDLDARLMGMGFTRVGVADGADAFLSNPAGLPFVRTFGTSDASPSSSVASATASVDEGADRWAVSWSGRSNVATQGWGAGTWASSSSYTRARGVAVGYGALLCLCADFTGGITLSHQSWQQRDMYPDQFGLDSENTWFDLGLMKRFTGDAQTWKVGLVANDVTDEFGGGVVFDFGASVELPNGLLIAADVNDITEEFDTTLNVGAEYPVPDSGAVLRAGLADEDFTAGAGYRWQNWEVGAAWLDLPGDDRAVVSFIGCF